MQSSLQLPLETYTEPNTSAFARSGVRTTVHSTTGRHDATVWRLDPSPQRYLRTWTSALSLRARPLQSSSHRGSDAHRIESQEEPPKTRHRPNTPAGELGLDLGPSDHIAAAWDTPLVSETAATMDSDEDSLNLHDDTVYDNAYDTDDNVYDVYYDVYEEMGVDYGEPPGATRPDGPWPDGIG